MSRIGKKPIEIPSGVTLTLDGQTVSVKGPKGQLAWTVAEEVVIKQEDGALTLTPRDESQRARAMWGLSRSLVFNLVKGVSDGYTRRLDISGVGYRAAIDGRILNLQLGYSHEIKFAIPEDVKIVCDTPTAVSISGADKQRVGQIAAEIRGFRRPEPYKGKGVKYAGERILRKEGKKK